MSALALGFRVKSGYAVAVALGGPSSAPVPIARRVLALSDSKIEATRQPYHDGFGTAQEDATEIARLTRIIERCAARSVRALLEDRALGDGRWRAASLVVGSTIDPATVGNPHIRAHASEGRLFRTVLENALRDHGVKCSVIVEKTLAAHAVKALGRPEHVVRKIVGAFGEAFDGPWRVDEKAAATAAWLALL